jgi:UDP-N-acetylglucosamine 2-epimerase (non-hydrolysing)
MNIDLIAGARPNFMKIASILKAFDKFKINYKLRLIHTGQHYDKKMSQVFFDDLNIPKPDINLNINGGGRLEQIGLIMNSYDSLLESSSVDLCIVVGDVNSTVACAISARNRNIPVAHVEAGIRSGDKKMPEEINRILTDSISDLFFTTTELATENLLATGINQTNIFHVGNTMIDTLVENLDRSKEPMFWKQLGLGKSRYFLLTLHRPSNVDDKINLLNLLNTLSASIRNNKIIFPVHPRTLKVIKELNLEFDNIVFLEPLGYLEFLFMIQNCRGIITDSGGITEEASFLNIPCITLRNSTERPETISHGTNVLVGSDSVLLLEHIQKMIDGNWKKYKGINLWDGSTGNRIAEIIMQLNENNFFDSKL